MADEQKIKLGLETDLPEKATEAANKLDELKEVIEFLKKRLEELAEEYKEGAHSEEQYKDSSDLLIKTLKEKEEIFARLTKTERDQQNEQDARIAKQMRLEEQLQAAYEKESAARLRAAEAERKLAEEDRKLAEAAAEVTAKIEEQARAQQNMAEIADEVETPLKRLTGQGEGEEAVGGFKGLAGGALKAEKAINSLASGHGLGRVGPMLESVLGPLGVPGLGLALGAIALEAEPAIRAVQGFVDAWDKGIKPMTEALQLIEGLNRAQGDAQRKRFRGRVESELANLEDKMAEQGFLDVDDTRKLRQLRGAAAGFVQEDLLEQAERDRIKQQEAAKTENLAIQQQMNKAFQDRQIESEKGETEAELHGVKAAQYKEKIQNKQFESTMRSDEEFNKKLETAQKHAETKDEQARRHAETQARKAEHEAALRASPEGQRREEREEFENLVQQNTYGFFPDEQAKIAGHMRQNYDMGLAVGHSISEQIQYAIMQTRVDVARGIQDSMRRNQVFTESYVQ